MANASAIGYLELNIKGFEQAISTAQKALAAFGVAISAYKGIQFFKDGVKDAIDFGNATYFAAQQMGKMDPGKFLLVQKALQNIGYSAEAAKSTMEDFMMSGRPIESLFGSLAQKRQALQSEKPIPIIENIKQVVSRTEKPIPAIENIKQIVSRVQKPIPAVENIKQVVSRTENIKQVVSRIEGTSNQKQRESTLDTAKTNAYNALTASQAYGKALATATEQYGAQAKILAANAAAFSKVFETIQAVAGKVREFFLGMTAQFLKPLQALLETLQGMDLAGMGAEFGKHIEKAINILNGLIKSGTLGETITTALQLGASYIEDAANYFTEVVVKAAAGFVVVLAAAMDNINWTGVLWRAMSNVAKMFITIGEIIARAIYGAMDGIGVIASMITDALGVSKDGVSVSEDLAKFKENQDSLGQTFGQLRQQTNEGAPDLIKTDEFAVSVKDAVVAALSDVGRAINPSEKTKALLDRLQKQTQAAEALGAQMAKDVSDKQGAFTYQKADPITSIADSLARVGGGGNAVQVGMSIQEKQLYTQQQILREQIRMTDAIRNFRNTPAAAVMQTDAVGINQ
jgi:hypothetical protein